MVALGAAMRSAAAAAASAGQGVLEAALQHAPAALMRFNVSAVCVCAEGALLPPREVLLHNLCACGHALTPTD
jgi:hypothetical protein